MKRQLACSWVVLLKSADKGYSGAYLSFTCYLLHIILIARYSVINRKTKYAKCAFPFQSYHKYYTSVINGVNPILFSLNNHTAKRGHNLLCFAGIVVTNYRNDSIKISFIFKCRKIINRNTRELILQGKHMSEINSIIHKSDL